VVLETAAQNGDRHGVVTRVARQLGINAETLRLWVKQADIDGGRRAGTTTADQRRITELEREVRELRRANEILKSAAAFFGAELDGRRTR
jgi:transposase